MNGYQKKNRKDSFLELVNTDFKKLVSQVPADESQLDPNAPVKNFWSGAALVIFPGAVEAVEKMRGRLRNLIRNKRSSKAFPDDFLKEIKRVNSMVTPLVDWHLEPSKHGRGVVLPQNPIHYLFFSRIPKPYTEGNRAYWGTWRYDILLSILIPKLQDPEWITALRECPGCGKFLLYSGSMEHKHCSKRCKNRHWWRINRGKGLLEN